MQNITSSTGLKNAILLLEADQILKGEQLKERLFLTYESFKPLNILTSTLNDISRSPFMTDNLIGTAMGLMSGFLSKKVFIGTSGNAIRKILGSVLQFGVTNVVAQNSDTIRSVGKLLFQSIRRKKEDNSENHAK